MLRPGDTVTLAVNPTVKIADFQSLKPYAALTRTLQVGQDPEVFQKELESDLHGELLRVLRVEVAVWCQIVDAKDKIETQDQLLAWCEQEIQTHGITRQVASGAPSAQGPAPSVQTRLGVRHPPTRITKPGPA